MKSVISAILFVGTSLGLTPPAPASAQACPERPPLADCLGPAPARGEAFSGPVLQVIDGATVCVAQGPLPSQWVRVRIVDAPAFASRGAMMAAVFARRIDCVASGTDGDSVRAACVSDGTDVGDLERTPGALSQAAGWR